MPARNPIQLPTAGRRHALRGQVRQSDFRRKCAQEHRIEESSPRRWAGWLATRQDCAHAVSERGQKSLPEPRVKQTERFVTIEDQESSLGPVRQTGCDDGDIFRIRSADFPTNRSTKGRRGRLAPAGVYPHNENVFCTDICGQGIEQVSLSYARMPCICVTSGSSATAKTSKHSSSARPSASASTVRRSSQCRTGIAKLTLFERERVDLRPQHRKELTGKRKTKKLERTLTISMRRYSASVPGIRRNLCAYDGLAKGFEESPVERFLDSVNNPERNACDPH
jgi:hypothetical protein